MTIKLNETIISPYFTSKGNRKTRENNKVKHQTVSETFSAIDWKLDQRIIN